MANTMSFLTIGSTDCSQWVDKQTYAINSEDVYETWTDANWVDHRVIVRQRVRGTVKLGFASAVDFASFTALLESARQADGFYSVTAYVSNTGATVTFDAYIDAKDETKWDLANSRQWHVQTLTIIGR